MSNNAVNQEERTEIGESVPEQFETFRNTVREMSAREVKRQLPNLVDTVVEHSEDPETLEFLIGISLSRSATLLDYQLERQVVDTEQDTKYQETLKPAISGEHLYLTFPYPPDPHFNAATLRGAILATIETDLSKRGRYNAVDKIGTTKSTQSIVTDILRQIGLL